MAELALIATCFSAYRRNYIQEPYVWRMEDPNALHQSH